jgi:hypothetical protein
MAKQIQVHRHIHLAGKIKLRTAKFMQKEHFVAPTIALQEGVVWPANAEQPEFVPGPVLARAPAAWNGRPVFMDHPSLDGENVSGNTPELLERGQFGHLFNTEFRDNKLHTEAWMDSDRAEAVGDDAVNAIERMADGKSVEVSVGAFILLEEEHGTYNGQEYFAVWKQIVPDHLAILPEGVKGACSIEAGCGTMRTNSAKEKHLDETTKSIWSKIGSIFSILRSRYIEDLGVRELRTVLDSTLKAADPNYAWIEDIVPATNEVIYAAFSDNYDIAMYRQKYEGTSDGKANLVGVREPVRATVDYIAAKSCGCQDTAACQCEHPKEEPMNRATVIAALLARPEYKEYDKDWLNNAPDAVLQMMTGTKKDSGANPPEPKPNAPAPNPGGAPAPPPQTQPTPDNPKPTATTPDLGEKPRTAQEFISQAPPEIAELLNDGLRAASERRNAVLAALKATNQTEFSEDELKAMKTPELERILRLAGGSIPKPDFTGANPVPHALANKDDGPMSVPKPPNMREKLIAARAKVQASA